MIFKVCGMRDRQNMLDLQSIQPDWMGLIFHPRSPRYVDSEIADMGDTPLRIGVFVDATNDFIAERVDQYHLKGVQLHGSESPHFCQHWRERDLLVIKAFALDHTFDFSVVEAYANSCDYFLFDTKGKTAGGTGEQFNWDVLKTYQGDRPFLLSGGIGPGDVDALKTFQHPAWAGIDINSRFESSPAMKNIKKIQTFKHALFS